MNDEDYKIVHAMAKYGGSFVKALAQAAFVADETNLARLKVAFPGYWKQYADMAEVDERVAARKKEGV